MALPWRYGSPDESNLSGLRIDLKVYAPIYFVFISANETSLNLREFGHELFSLPKQEELNSDL